MVRRVGDVALGVAVVARFALAAGLVAARRGVGGGGFRRGLGAAFAARFTLQTGRTHQIRQHAAMAGVPIVGDRRYGGDAGTWLERLALHAGRLRLTHPATGDVMTWTAPLPPPLDSAWAAAGGPADALKG